MDEMQYFELGLMMGKMSGGSTSSDPRIKKLISLPELWRFDIADGWNVRVKISADIDASCHMIFNRDTKQPNKYYESYSAYYCVYLNDDFKFADHYEFYPKRLEDYAGTYTDAAGNIVFVPNHISTYSDIECVSGEMTVKNSESGIINIGVDLKCTETVIVYHLNEQGEWVPYDPPNVNTNHHISPSHYILEAASYSYIVNGGADYFHKNMLSFYYACTKLM